MANREGDVVLHFAQDSPPPFSTLACLGLAWFGRVYFVFLKFVDGTDRLSGRVGKKLQLLDA